MSILTCIYQTLWRWIYSLLLILCIPAILLRLWWRGRKNPAYRQRWPERFGIFNGPKQKGGIWVHSVSLGESITAVPMIRQLQQRFPNLPITVTTTTPTGSATIQNAFKDSVFHVYFPYDFPWCFNLFLKRLAPRILVIMETELWPNCLWSCRKQHIPVLVVNGRLSPVSMQGYQRIKPLTQLMLGCVSHVVAQSQMDGSRFVDLGLDPKKLIVTGNMKFDVPLKPGIEAEALQLKQSMGARPIWVAASTHGGEEEQVLEAFSKLRLQVPDLLLILVPRHPERFIGVAQLLKDRGFAFVSRSSGDSVKPETAIFLGDTVGELNLFYAASDIAFVGGSLVPIGGHNTLEPAAFAVPMIVGPHVHNFVEITKLLTEAGALIQISDSDSLAKAVLNWLSSEDVRKLAGASGKRVVENNRGAIKAIVDLIGQKLEAPKA